MKFWEAKAYNKETEKEVVFHVAGDISYKTAKVKKALLEVHPEYENLRLKRIKKPEGWTAFESR